MPHSFNLAIFILPCMLFFSTSVVRADCTDNGIWTWPQDSLAVNGRIIITGYAMDQEMIRNFSFQHPRLVSSSEEIPLLVEVVYESQFYLTQAVLIPSQPLQSGIEYRLEVDSSKWLYGRKYPSFYPNDSNEFRWTIRNEFDATPPKWLEGPTVFRAGFTAVGCGPIRHLIFDCAVDEAQPFAIEVELSPIDGSSKTQKFILTSEREHLNCNAKDTFRIGHHVCAGEFFLKDDVSYRARFTAIDASGNRAEYSRSCRLSYTTESAAKDGSIPSFRQEDCIESTIGQEEKERIRVD